LSLTLWTLVVGPLGAILAVPLTLAAKAMLVDAHPEARWINAFLVTDPDARKYLREQAKAAGAPRGPGSAARGAASVARGPASPGHNGQRAARRRPLPLPDQGLRPRAAGAAGGGARWPYRRGPGARVPVRQRHRAAGTRRAGLLAQGWRP